MEMSDIYRTRRERLRDIVRDKFDNKAAALARKLDVTDPVITRALGNEEKPIGEKQARDFELKLKLPPYWLDGLNTGVQWPFKSVDINRIHSLTQDQQKNLENVIDSFVKSFENQEPSQHRRRNNTKS